MFLCFCINQIILLHVIIKHAHGTGWEWTFSKSKSMQICMYTVYSICAVFVYVILELRVLEISDTFICTGNIFAMINESIKLSCVNCRQLSQFFPDDWCYKKKCYVVKKNTAVLCNLKSMATFKKPTFSVTFLIFWCEYIHESILFCHKEQLVSVQSSVSSRNHHWQRSTAD